MYFYRIHYSLNGTEKNDPTEWPTLHSAEARAADLKASGARDLVIERVYRD